MGSRQGCYKSSPARSLQPLGLPRSQPGLHTRRAPPEEISTPGVCSRQRQLGQARGGGGRRGQSAGSRPWRLRPQGTEVTERSALQPPVTNGQRRPVSVWCFAIKTHRRSQAHERDELSQPQSEEFLFFFFFFDACRSWRMAGAAMSGQVVGLEQGCSQADALPRDGTTFLVPPRCGSRGWMWLFCTW